MSDEESSEPFFKGIGVIFVEVEEDDGTCDLCAVVKDHPIPDAPSPSFIDNDNRWGVPHDTINNKCLCKESDESEQHAFHLKCFRTFVSMKKSLYRKSPMCPMCAGFIGKGGVTAGAGEEKTPAGEDELIVEDEEVGALGGKARKRDKHNYSLFIHIIQATGLKLLKSDRAVQPVAVVNGFGKERKTEIGKNNKKTYSIVWDSCFTMQKSLDDDELAKETITIKIQDHKKLFFNDAIGEVKLNAETIRAANENHEFYRLWVPITQIHSAGDKSNKNTKNITTQGKLQLSICCFNDKDFEKNPKLPVHIYDLEVQMWAELDDKKAVEDYDFNGNYLQNKLEQKQAQDQTLISDEWDILHIKIYKAEDLPKVDKTGWCDAYIELQYRGLLDKNKKLKTKTINKQKDPVFNTEFEIPIPSDQPILYNRIDFIMKDENKLQSDVEIGRCRINISDILALHDNPAYRGKPVWKTLYQDKDGEAPTYRGRVLMDFTVERNIKTAKMNASPCASPNELLIPRTCSYSLDIDVLEALHLPAEYSDYQVDVTLGHSLLGAEKEADRDKTGRTWVTFESLRDVKTPSKKIIPFYTKKTALIHNLPSIDELRKGYFSPALSSPTVAGDAGITDDSALVGVDSTLPSIASPDEKKGIVTTGFQGDGDSVPTTSSPVNFNNNTIPVLAAQQIPDIIIYISKKGSKEKCIGYLRIPIDGRKRPTENWEHGEDLTLFPGLLGKEGEKDDDNSARCLPLKPLVEMYEAICGFLLFRVQLRPVTPSAESIKLSNQLVYKRLEPVARQRYKLSACIYQAKDLASVDSSGLSSPWVSVECMDIQLKSKPRMNTCYPLWFETVESFIDLPVNTLYAPDITVTCYHYKPKSIFKFRDPSIFMGKAEITAITAKSIKQQEQPSPAWYPLMFEEHQYGSILLGFSLTPEKDLGILSVTKNSLDDLIDSWESYAVDVSALAMRGPLSLKCEKNKVDPIYELECWNDVQSFTQSQALQNKLTMMIRKPTLGVFYSSLNVRVYEGKDLIAVCSLSVDKILRTGTGWYKLVEVLMRTEEKLQAKFARMWKRFIAKKKAKKLAEQNAANPPITTASAADPLTGPSDVVIDVKEAPTGAVAPTGEETDKTSRFAYLRESNTQETKGDKGEVMIQLTTSSPTSTPRPLTGAEEKEADSLIKGVHSDSDVSSNRESVKIDIKVDPGVDPTKAKIAASKMLQPREVDENGNEKINEKQVIKLQCEQIAEKDADSPWDRHWKIETEYEMLPLTRDPFISADLFTGKDEIHQTFLEKLFARSKHSVGILRGNFYAYRVPGGKKLSSTKEEEKTAANNSNNFDLERYRNASQYTIRVYILRCLQLVTKKGRATECDPFVQIQYGEGIKGGVGETSFKTDVVESTINPKYYKVFDFGKCILPAIDSNLVITVFNDNGMINPDLVGQTTIALENRLFSKQWFNGRRMTERRPLFVSKRGRLPQGFVEVCIDIIPQHLAGERPLDYLLNPPKREPWELRCILWNTRNVTPKKIYKHDDDCCCYDLCAPPNQSDIKLVCGLSGPGKQPQATDIHYRSIDGEGMFNWRTIHTIDLPAPELLAYFKVQIWNINWNPDDCIAEAILPLWGWFEFCRRTYEKDKENKEKWVFRLPKQWVKLTHPQNTDKGEVEMELELLPASVAGLTEYKAASGEQGWELQHNSSAYVLPKYKRPESSFPWYRIDKQIIWRIKYCFKKSRWILLGSLLIALCLIVGLALLKKYVF